MWCRMLESCPLERWDTPFSNAIAVSLISAVDEESLCITLEAEQYHHRDLWCIKFSPGYSYAVTKLELSPEKRSAMYRDALRDGWTRFHNEDINIDFSPTDSERLLEKMRMTVSHLGSYQMHFMIITNTTVINIYSNSLPQLQKIGRKRNTPPARSVL